MLLLQNEEPLNERTISFLVWGSRHLGHLDVPWVPTDYWKGASTSSTESSTESSESPDSTTTDDTDASAPLAEDTADEIDPVLAMFNYASKSLEIPEFRDFFASTRFKDVYAHVLITQYGVGGVNGMDHRLCATPTSIC